MNTTATPYHVRSHADGGHQGIAIPVLPLRLEGAHGRGLRRRRIAWRDAVHAGRLSRTQS